MTGQPYLYAIGWTALDVWYLGCRYAQNCSPADLWTSYFTSSKVVAKFRKLNGEPDHIEVLFTGDAIHILKSEQEALTEFGITSSEKWLNQRSSHTSGTDYWRCLTPEQREKARQNMRKPRSERGRLGHKRAAQKRRKISDEQVVLILSDDRTYRTIAQDYGVSAEAIRKIKASA